MTRDEIQFWIKVQELKTYLTLLKIMRMLVVITRVQEAKATIKWDGVNRQQKDFYFLHPLNFPLKFQNNYFTLCKLTFVLHV